MTKASLTEAEIDAAGLDDWCNIGPALHTRFRTRNFKAGLQLVNLIGEAAEEADHHPDLDLRYGHLNIRLYSHDVFGVTTRDVDMARKISALAASVNVAAEPSAVAVLDLCLDTPDYERVKPFWRAVLGYRDHPDAPDEVRDDDTNLPALWFQVSGSEEPRQRFHFDIRVPADVAKQRIDAGVAAGGSIVDEQPRFVVLADADGNKVCVCS